MFLRVSVDSSNQLHTHPIPSHDTREEHTDTPPPLPPLLVPVAPELEDPHHPQKAQDAEHAQVVRVLRCGGVVVWCGWLVGGWGVEV